MALILIGACVSIRAVYTVALFDGFSLTVHGGFYVQGRGGGGSGKDSKVLEEGNSR